MADAFAAPFPRRCFFFYYYQLPGSASHPLLSLASASRPRPPFPFPSPSPTPTSQPWIQIPSYPTTETEERKQLLAG
jgi:hypothetical protein